MTITAKEMMTSPAFTVLPLTSVAEVARLLSSKGVSAVPVCNTDGILQGVVSEDDILKPFRETIRLRRDWWLGILADGESLSQDYLDAMRPDNRTAGEIMVRHVIVAEETATLPELAELMVRHHVKRIPIVRSGRVIGIVSRRDLVAAIARAPAMLV